MKYFAEQIDKTQHFTYFPAKSAFFKCRLSGDGAITKNDYGLTSWKLEEKNKQVTLHLFKGDTLECILKVTASGDWSGRDFIDGTRVILRPNNQVDWKTFLTPANRRVDWSQAAARHRWKSGPIDFASIGNRIIPPDTPNENPESDTAIILVGYDRPDYYTSTVQALAANPLAHKYPVYAFLDKPSRGDLQVQHKEITQAHLPHAVCYMRDANLGCGRNIIDARRRVFDEMDYSRAYVFEDDMIVSPQYLQLTSNLMDWSQANYENVGAVQGWIPCVHNKTSKLTRLTNIQPTFCNWWGYLMTKQCWDSIKDTLYFFEDTFLRGKYEERPYEAVKSWMNSLLSDRPKPRSGKSYPLPMHYHSDREALERNAPGGQDGVTALAFTLQGWIKLATQVNRAEYIGSLGIHMTPDRFRAMGYQNVKLDEFADDSSIVDFIPSERWNDPCGMDGFSHFKIT